MWLGKCFSEYYLLIACFLFIIVFLFIYYFHLFYLFFIWFRSFSFFLLISFGFQVFPLHILHLLIILITDFTSSGSCSSNFTSSCFCCPIVSITTNFMFRIPFISSFGSSSVLLFSFFALHGYSFDNE